jgi:hypothetical protein
LVFLQPDIGETQKAGRSRIVTTPLYWRELYSDRSSLLVFSPSGWSRPGLLGFYR